MLLNRETASEIVRLLSEGFDLPVRIYLSLWYKPIACAYSKRLCKHFVNDVELLKKATPYNDGCILFYWTPYGECSVLLCGNSQQYIILVSTEQIPIFAAAIKSAKSAQTGAKGYAGFYADSTLQSTWQA